MPNYTGTPNSQLAYFSESPHERPCRCAECMRAYHRLYSRSYNRRTATAEARNPHLFAECPHPRPCWCMECRRAYNRLQARDYKRTSTGLAWSRRTAIQQTHKRRVLKLGRASEPYTVTELLERDGHRCHICRRKVDPSLPATHPKGATVDHILPISVGGDDSRANVAIAHWSCNQRKGNRPANDQLRLIG